MRYGKIVSNINVPRATQICKFLQQCSQLREMIPGTLTEIDLAIANRMVEESFEQGEVIFHQGDDGEKFYMIRSGSVNGVRVKEDGTSEEFKLKEGEFFGEVALLEGKERERHAARPDRGGAVFAPQGGFRRHSQVAPELRAAGQGRDRSAVVNPYRRIKTPPRS